MSLDYRLTVATDADAESVAARAFPDPAECPRAGAEAPNVLGRDLSDAHGYAVAVRAGRDGYVSAEGNDDTMWIWEPAHYVSVAFMLGKDDPDVGLRQLLGAVNRVLVSGDEDVALTVVGDVLILNRIGGVLTKHRRAQWWDAKPWMDQLVP